MSLSASKENPAGFSLRLRRRNLRPGRRNFGLGRSDSGLGRSNAEARRRNAERRRLNPGLAASKLHRPPSGGSPGPF